MTGTEMIANEREEQIIKHGYTLEHDRDIETNGGLIDGAQYLLRNYSGYEDNSKYFPEKWMDYTKEKFDMKGDIETLTVAGALIAAEIDRISLGKVTKD